MSRAQTVRLGCQLGGFVLAGILFLLLPFGGVTDFLIGAVAWLLVGAIGERYFRRHATLEEIRADLEERKGSG